MLEGYAVIYAPGKSVSYKTLGRGIGNIENYVATSALTVIDMPIDSRSCAQRLRAAMDSLNSLTERKFRGIIVIITVDSFIEQELYSDKLTEIESIVTQKFDKPVEFVCCYYFREARKMSLAQMISILNLHHRVMHNDGLYSDWYPRKIFELVSKSFDKMFGPGMAKSVFKSLKWIYKISEDCLVSEPQVFEEKLRKLLGSDKADKTIGIIIDDFSRKLVFKAS